MNKKIIFNIIGFYFCWWATIYASYLEYYFMGPIFVVLFLGIHFLKIVYHKYELYFLFICLFIGFSIDTFFLKFNIISYKGYLPEVYNIAPMWVSFLWVCFGATIYHSFKWIKTRYLLMAILSAISGPLIYFSAENLEVVTVLSDTNLYIAIISITWFLFIPLLIFISDKLVESK